MVLNNVCVFRLCLCMESNLNIFRSLQLVFSCNVVDSEGSIIVFCHFWHTKKKDFSDIHFLLLYLEERKKIRVPDRLWKTFLQWK